MPTPRLLQSVYGCRDRECFALWLVMSGDLAIGLRDDSRAEVCPSEPQGPRLRTLMPRVAREEAGLRVRAGPMSRRRFNQWAVSAFPLGLRQLDRGVRIAAALGLPEHTTASQLLAARRGSPIAHALAQIAELPTLRASPSRSDAGCQHSRMSFSLWFVVGAAICCRAGVAALACRSPSGVDACEPLPDVAQSVLRGSSGPGEGAPGLPLGGFVSGDAAGHGICPGRPASGQG
jgi:hypothetical protein